MANQWLRLYSEFAHDPKIQRMSEALQRRFVMLLCIRCGNGGVTLHDEDVTFQLRISNDEWAETKAIFREKNLIDDNNNPAAWDKRQFSSDSSAARVSKHRAKKKVKCNVTVTAQIQNRTDTDTEQKEQKQRAPRFDAQAHLVSIGVDPLIAADWIQHRKTVKATPTLTAIDGIANEAARAGISLADALATCCQRGWRGFKAEWMRNSEQEHATRKTQHQLNQEATTRAIFGNPSEFVFSEKLISGEVIS